MLLPSVSSIFHAAILITFESQASILTMSSFYGLCYENIWQLFPVLQHTVSKNDHPTPVPGKVRYKREEQE